MKFRSAILSAAVATAALVAFAPPAPAAVSTAMPTCASGDAVVWENTKTKVFHLQGDSHYGTTKSGAYACQSAATSAGFHLAGSKHHGAMNSGGAMGSGSATTGTATSPAAMASDAGAPSAMASPIGKHHHRHRGTSMSPASAAPVPAPSAT